MLRVKIPKNLPGKTITSSSLPAQGLKNWHFKTLQFCFTPSLRTTASVAQLKILHSRKKAVESRDWWHSNLLPCCTTFIFVIPSKFCKVTDRHRLLGKKKIQGSWNCVGLQHRRQHFYMPTQQEKAQLLLIDKHLVQLVWSVVTFPCLLCKSKAKLLLLYSILPISNTVPYQLSLHF